MHWIRRRDEIRGVLGFWGRGLNELDQILVPFVQNEFNSLEEKEKFLLVELLEFEDVDLADLILYRKMEPELEFEEIILKIIKFSSEI